MNGVHGTMSSIGRRQTQNYSMGGDSNRCTCNALVADEVELNPGLAITPGKGLREHLLAPLLTTFGHMSIHSAFRSYGVNKFCNELQYSNERRPSSPAPVDVGAVRSRHRPPHRTWQRQIERLAGGVGTRHYGGVADDRSKECMREESVAILESGHELRG